MTNCQACGVPVTFAVNLDTQKRVPLVLWNPAYPKAVRYRMSENTRNYFICARDDNGAYMTHFTDCTQPNRFSKGKKK